MDESNLKESTELKGVTSLDYKIGSLLLLVIVAGGILLALWR